MSWRCTRKLGWHKHKPHATKRTTYTSMFPLHLTLSISYMAGTNKGRGREGGEKNKRGKGTEVSFALSLIPLIFSLPPDPIPLLTPAHVHNHRHLYCGEFNYSTAFSQVILSNGIRLLIWWAHQMSHLGLCSWMWLRMIIILCGIAPLHNLWSPAILKYCHVYTKYWLWKGCQGFNPGVLTVNKRSFHAFSQIRK